MTELEYEKAGRGPYRVVSGEFSWGSTSITAATGISNGGTGTEGPSAAANCVYTNNASVQGPMRVGAMAYGDSTRVAGGVGYYGVMDLTGNLWEQLVTVGRSTGRGFKGFKHGNGALTSVGDADTSTWPGTDAVGNCFRGGSWATPGSNALRLSDRTNGAVTSAGRDNQTGGRGVRSAP